jgi:hypothetical protein
VSYRPKTIEHCLAPLVHAVSSIHTLGSCIID